MLWKSLKEDTFRPDREVNQTFIHLDASKPEWNTSVIKPHVTKGGGFIDIDHKTTEKIRQIYFKRLEELEEIRFSKAKKAIFVGDKKACQKQLLMIKDANPFKYSKLDVEKWITKLETAFTKLLNDKPVPRTKKTQGNKNSKKI